MPVSIYQMLILRDELQSSSPARSPCHQRSVSQIIFPDKVSHCKSEESNWISECVSSFLIKIFYVGTVYIILGLY